MVATTFAADTPLVVTGWVRDYGIWKNWLWWCYAISTMLVVFLFSRWWRRSGVMTKAELTELRYPGRGAQVLRGFLGMLHAGVTNTMVLNWVILAATKILSVLFAIQNKWFSVALACGLAMSYSLLSGFWGVVITDALQFVISVIGAVSLAVICWNVVGGREGIQQAIEAGDVYSAETLRLLPPPGEGMPWQVSFWSVSFTAIAIYLGMGWWANEGVDGDSLVVQRICATRNERQGILSVLWYSLAHYALRPWPWIVVALASMIVLPRLEEVRAPFSGTVESVSAVDRSILLRSADSELPVRVSLVAEDESEDWQVHPLPLLVGQQVSQGQVIAAADSERAYVVMLKRYLPVGLLGLVLASLLAAFMSTIDTHVNLAASFFVNDVYRRFLVPEANSPKHYVFVARLASVSVLAIAGVLAYYSRSMGKLFEFFLAFLAGVGPVYFLRWTWWRVTAWTEIVASVTSGLTATALTHFVIDWSFLGPLSTDGNLEPVGRLVLVASPTLVVALFSLLVLPSPDPQELVAFYRRVRPLGAWGPVRVLSSRGPTGRVVCRGGHRRGWRLGRHLRHADRHRGPVAAGSDCRSRGRGAFSAPQPFPTPFIS